MDLIFGNAYTLALLYCRGNERDSVKPCPITFKGLVALHNTFVKFKLNHGERNLVGHLLKQKQKEEWSGLNEYAKKNGALFLVKQNSNRLETVTEGQDETILNSGLYLNNKLTTVTNINGSLVPN
jgi:hypothetical protein